MRNQTQSLFSPFAQSNASKEMDEIIFLCCFLGGGRKLHKEKRELGFLVGSRNLEKESYV